MIFKLYLKDFLKDFLNGLFIFHVYFINTPKKALNYMPTVWAINGSYLNISLCVLLLIYCWVFYYVFIYFDFIFL